MVDNGVEESLQDKLELKKCDYFEIFCYNQFSCVDMPLGTCKLFNEP